MDTGRVFFGTAGVETMIQQMINSEIKLGVLPYPTEESGMTSQNFDWAGYFCIPTSVEDQTLSGEVVELLSYYGETMIKREFYGVLLGNRAAEELQDQEMLELIFDNLVADPALAFLNMGHTDMAYIYYVVPRLINLKQKAMSSWYVQYYRVAKSQLDQLNK